LDALLSLEELAGFTLSNRPMRPGQASPGRAAVVLVADHFPVQNDPMVELADRVEDARVEALRRPRAADVTVARRLAIDYLEDDGQLQRLLATGQLVLRHPRRAFLDLARRGPDVVPLRVLAPAVARLEHDPGARVHALGEHSRSTAERLAQLAGRTLE
jgi:enoyl reductase-like protein